MIVKDDEINHMYSEMANNYLNKPLRFNTIFLRGLYTYFLYITKFRYMKEEVETFQKIYIKVYGVK